MAEKGKDKEKENKPPIRRGCGTMQVHERMLRTVRGYREARDSCENHAWRAAFSPYVGRTGCTKIPVVVHVVYKTSAQNISDAQVKSQIDVLNADFRKKNPDTSTVPAPFQPLVDDARIEFELATVDPDGNPTDGIDRVSTTNNSFTDDDGVKSTASGGADPWPSDRYLNIWVCQLASFLGYAQFPGGPAATDGVVILHSAFGTTGTAAAPFDLGRTATHEIGHWLNLRHIWGDDGNGCSGSDFVADTPNQAGPNYGTPAFPSVSCSNGPNGDMFMNYMDYVDDVAMVMFSQGQVNRMQATLDGTRSSIGTSTPCGKILPKEFPKDGPKEFPKEFPKDLPKEWPKEFPKEGPKDFPKEFPKEFPKDGPKEFPKDGPKDFPKEFPKEFPKDGPKEFPKDGPKDFPKEFPKEFPKDGPKEFPKEFPKDGPKELPKDGPKDFPKEPVKDGPKDGPKDFPKDPALEPPKNPVADPPKGPSDLPKGLLDPPKSFLEPPINFPTIPSQPFGTGGLPFVLATPATGGAYHSTGQPPSDLASTYLQLMSHYAQLHSQGMLDAAGLEAWKNAAAAYQQLVGGGGASC